MKPKASYRCPEVGTVFKLASAFAKDIRFGPIKDIADVLEKQGLISEYMKPVGYCETLKVRLSDYLDKSPKRKHDQHWIDGGKQVAVFHPETCLPFFMNESGSKICRFCDGNREIGELIEMLQKNWPSIKKKVLVRDLLKFLFLLKELDLVEFEG